MAFANGFACAAIGFGGWATDYKVIIYILKLLNFFFRCL